MHLLIMLILFVYGAVFGSFLNVVGLRVPTQTLFKEKRSYCDNCQRTLSWLELIPIGSYLFQKGRCRECEANISLLYPIMEASTGMLFAFSYYHFGFTRSFVLALSLIALIIPITVSDFFYQKIPNRILIFFSPLFILYRLLYPLHPFWTSILGALFAFFLVFIIIYLSNGGMGMGDLKYYTLFGFIFGFTHFLLLFFLSTFYGVIAGLFIMRKEGTGRKTKIAFGPYIGLAALTVHYYGDSIIYWYFNLLN